MGNKNDIMLHLISMKKKTIKYLIIFTFLIIILVTFSVIFYLRAPVLIVAEEVFIEIYGAKRLRRESFRNSLLLFRDIKTVVVANDISDDLVPFSVDSVSKQPYCVLFPLRFTNSAMIYHGANPGIMVIILDGRNNNEFKINSNPETSNLFKYATDIEADFFRAGVISAAFQLPPPENEESPVNENQKRHIIVFLESHLNQLYGQKIKESFKQGINQHENPPEPLFYTSFSEFTGNFNLSCVILAGSGSEYLDNKSGVPVIMFSWLDPYLTTSDTVLVIDDSPLAQVYQAVKLAESGTENGTIKSEFVISNRKKMDKNLLSIIRESR